MWLIRMIKKKWLAVNYRIEKIQEIRRVNLTGHETEVIFADVAQLIETLISWSDGVRQSFEYKVNA